MSFLCSFLFFILLFFDYSDSINQVFSRLEPVLRKYGKFDLKQSSKYEILPERKENRIVLHSITGNASRIPLENDIDFIVYDNLSILTSFLKSDVNVKNLDILLGNELRVYINWNDICYPTLFIEKMQTVVDSVIRFQALRPRIWNFSCRIIVPKSFLFQPSTVQFEESLNSILGEWNMFFHVQMGPDSYLEGLKSTDFSFQVSDFLKRGLRLSLEPYATPNSLRNKLPNITETLKLGAQSHLFYYPVQFIPSAEFTNLLRGEGVTLSNYQRIIQKLRDDVKMHIHPASYEPNLSSGRWTLLGSVLTIYHFILHSLKQALLESFKSELTTLEFSETVLVVLKKSKLTALNQFQNAMNTIRKDMEALLSQGKQEQTKRMWAPNPKILLLPNQIRLEYEDLEDKMNVAIQEKILSFESTGQLNPYIRTSAFPPLHINFNFQTIPALRSPNFRLVKRLIAPLWLSGYDGHSEGKPATERADPLIFRNFAQVPFYPAFGTTSKIMNGPL